MQSYFPYRQTRLFTTPAQTGFSSLSPVAFCHRWEENIRAKEMHKHLLRLLELYQQDWPRALHPVFLKYHSHSLLRPLSEPRRWRTQQSVFLSERAAAQDVKPWGRKRFHPEGHVPARVDVWVCYQEELQFKEPELLKVDRSWPSAWEVQKCRWKLESGDSV